MNDSIRGDQKIQLGCGSLILIALIVIIFGGGSGSDEIHDLEREVRSLQGEVVLLREAVEEHTECLAQIRDPDREIPLEATD